MKKFDTLVNEVYGRILEVDPQQQPVGIPQDGGPTAVPQQAPAQPDQQQAPPPAPAPEAEPLTSEGKKFLVELALKALAVDPDTISAQDKALFETPVTTENADQIADRIRQIIDGL